MIIKITRSISRDNVIMEAIFRIIYTKQLKLTLMYTISAL